jgi:hypothetical protein
LAGADQSLRAKTANLCLSRSAPTLAFRKERFPPVKAIVLD